MKYGFAWTLSGKGELVRNLFFSVSADNPLLAGKILLLNSQMVWNLRRAMSGICRSFPCFTARAQLPRLRNDEEKGVSDPFCAILRSGSGHWRGGDYV